MVFQEPWALGAMAPSHRLQKRSLQPTLRGPQRSTGADDGHVQQAGRSSTNLNAQASAQSLREASRPGSRDRSSSRRPPPLNTGNIPPFVTDLPSPQLLSPHYNGTVSPYAPHISSPLNPTPSHTSGSQESRKDSDDTSESASSSDPRRGASIVASTSGAGASAIGSLPQTSTTQSLPRVPEMAQADSSASFTRSVRDLGSDYTRYYNPFATHNNSQQDLSTPLPPYNQTSSLLHPNAAIASTDLAKRLSNPFMDSKRVSNPFESAANTAPPTPGPEMSDPDHIAPVPVAPPIPPRSGTPLFITNADPEKVQFYADDRLGAPWTFPLYSDEAEDDDEMHMPRWDDDRRYKPKLADRFSRENIVNTIGMIFILTGLLCIFVVLPVVSYTTNGIIGYTYDTPLDQMPGYGKGDGWAHVNDKSYPLLKNIRTGLIDPDTPSSAKTRKGIDGDEYVLVFSDEFNEKNRTFYPGDDPYWFAPDLWYGATQDLEWYDPDAVNTGDGTLQLQLDAFANHDLGYRSGMLNSWNQLCFKGGIFEVSVSLPGPAGIHGLWPGVWTMGNLGRPGYLATTDGLWPYTYDDCDAGITPNQSMTDGTSWLPGQRLPNCVCYGEDHPSPGTGRGAPEIDIIEVSADWGGKGFSVATQSFQVAPFDIWYYPNYNFMENPNYNISLVNTWTGGPYQQAVSTTSMLNNEWYDGKAYQKYAFEYVPGGDKDAFVSWIIGEDEMMKFDGRALGPNGNVKQRHVSEEPMSMILNLGFSHSWVDIDMANLRFPTVMRIDYVRWYQKPGESMVTCDPPGYETTDYIAKHPEAYNNNNLTHWADAGYSFPKNTLMHGCKADTSS